MTKAMKRVTCLACVAVMGLGAAMFAACDDQGNNPGGDTSREVEELYISGSSSVAPLMEKLASVYESFNPYVDITVQTSDSGTGVADAIAGKNDFGMASRAFKDSEIEQGVTSKQIAIDGVALVVNPDADLDDVTSDQVYQLYANGTAIGAITNAISREDGSGTRDAFDSLIKSSAGDELGDLLTFNACVTIQQSTGGVKEVIATAGTTNTIGYISMGSIDDTVKTVKFEGVEATAENVKNGSYTLSRPFNIVYKSEDDLSEAAKLFIDFIMSDAGQLIAENEGYISVSDSL